MGRIRTIKPEFPQNEKIGRLSREARLLFVLLWTFADDEGRARAASRMLASLLYPYDLDAPDLIDSWLRELEAGGCIKLYEVNGSKYLEIHDWLDHQKIDRPTRSRLPKFASPPRKLDEASTTDLNPGPRTMDLNLGREASANTREVSSKTGPASSSPDVTDLDVKRVKAPRHGAVSDDKQHIYLRKGTADYEAYAQDYREVVGEEPNTTDQGRWFKIAGAKVA